MAEQGFDLKQFAKELEGRQYGYGMFSEKELKTAKDNGVVIVTGASDDLIEFEGAIFDEGDCYEGGRIRIDEKGITSNKERSRVIDVVWCGDDTDAVWTYITDIPHETFRIYEDDEIFCEGLVFFKKDLNLEVIE